MLGLDWNAVSHAPLALLLSHERCSTERARMNRILIGILAAACLPFIAAEQCNVWFYHLVNACETGFLCVFFISLFFILIYLLIMYFILVSFRFLFDLFSFHFILLYCLLISFHFFSVPFLNNDMDVSAIPSMC